MKAFVAVVDYGMGNVLSVQRAIEYCGGCAVLTRKPDELDGASHIVLPGVGAFRDGMAALADRGLIDPLRRCADDQRPLLGICLGMQMLFETSDEFGSNEGLGIVPGRVVAIPPVTSEGQPHKIPHISWTALELPSGAALGRWENTILSETPLDAAAYFLHSFTAVPTCAAHRLADAHYDGQLISAAIQNGSVVGTQFHPEKSGECGLAMLRQFLVQR